MRIELDGSMTLSVEEYIALYRTQGNTKKTDKVKAVVRVHELHGKKFKKFTEKETAILQSVLDSKRYRTKAGRIKHKKMLQLSKAMNRSVASISSKLSLMRSR